MKKRSEETLSFIRKRARLLQGQTVDETERYWQELTERATQEALENFESEIRHQITADITAANKDELLGLQQEFESKRQELSDKKEEIEQIEKQLKEEYEPVFGKDLLYKQRLNKFDSFCQENADLSLEEALAQYRALSGSKLLKK